MLMHQLVWSSLYLLAVEVSAITDGDPISEYTAQDGEVYESSSYPMVIYENKYSYLVTPASSGTYTYEKAHLQELMARLEISWEYFLNTTGRSPPGTMVIKDSGGTQLPLKPTIAIVPRHCGAACGALGAGSVETDLLYMDEIYKRIINGWETRGLIEYEFGRNFWFYDGHYQKDGAHWFHMAQVFATVIGYLSGVAAAPGNWEYSTSTGWGGGSCQAPGDGCLKEWVLGGYQEPFVLQISGFGGSPTDEAANSFNIHSIGGMFLWIIDNYGQEALNSWFREVYNLPSASGDFDQVLSNIMVATSRATQQNMYNFFTKYMKFPEQPDVQTAIADEFPSSPSEFAGDGPVLLDMDHQAIEAAGNATLLRFFRRPALQTMYNALSAKVSLEPGDYKVKAKIYGSYVPNGAEVIHFDDHPREWNSSWDDLIKTATTHFDGIFTNVELDCQLDITGDAYFNWVFFDRKELFIDSIRLISVATGADLISNWDFNQAKMMTTASYTFPEGRAVPGMGAGEAANADWKLQGDYYSWEIISLQAEPPCPWGMKACACVNPDCGCTSWDPSAALTCDRTDCFMDLTAADASGNETFAKLTGNDNGGYFSIITPVSLEAGHTYRYTAKFQSPFTRGAYDDYPHFVPVPDFAVSHATEDTNSTGYTIYTANVTVNSCSDCSVELHTKHYDSTPNAMIYYKHISLVDLDSGKELVQNPSFDHGIKGWSSYNFLANAPAPLEVVSMAWDADESGSDDQPCDGGGPGGSGGSGGPGGSGDSGGSGKAGASGATRSTVTLWFLNLFIAFGVFLAHR